MANIYFLNAPQARRQCVAPPLDGEHMAHLNDTLLLVDLPLVAGQPSIRVLCLVTEQSTNTVTLVVDDTDGQPVTHHLIGTTVPPEFSPQPLGAVSAFLARNALLTEAVVLAGGVKHGNLTIARAVHSLVCGAATTAEDALSSALATAASAARWNAALESLAKRYRTA